MYRPGKFDLVASQDKGFSPSDLELDLSWNAITTQMDTLFHFTNREMNTDPSPVKNDEKNTKRESVISITESPFDADLRGALSASPIIDVSPLINRRRCSTKKGEVSDENKENCALREVTKEVINQPPKKDAFNETLGAAELASLLSGSFSGLSE